MLTGEHVNVSAPFRKGESLGWEIELPSDEIVWRHRPTRRCGRRRHLRPAGARFGSIGAPSGSVAMHVGQAGYIGGITKGGGVLHFRGRNYPFDVAGAGVGGIGVTRFDGQGPVYNLTSVSEFAGPFAELRTGLAIGFRGQGKMMLRNRNGVVMRLSGTRKGLALSTGVDAMVVSLAR
jgi:hypothetical protein